MGGRDAHVEVNGALVRDCGVSAREVVPTMAAEQEHERSLDAPLWTVADSSRHPENKDVVLERERVREREQADQRSLVGCALADARCKAKRGRNLPGSCAQRSTAQRFAALRIVAKWSLSPPAGPPTGRDPPPPPPPATARARQGLPRRWPAGRSGTALASSSGRRRTSWALEAGPRPSVPRETPCKSHGQGVYMLHHA